MSIWFFGTCHSRSPICSKHDMCLCLAMQPDNLTVIMIAYFMHAYLTWSQCFLVFQTLAALVLSLCPQHWACLHTQFFVSPFPPIPLYHLLGNLWTHTASNLFPGFCNQSSCLLEASSMLGMHPCWHWSPELQSLGTPCLGPGLLIILGLSIPISCAAACAILKDQTTKDFGNWLAYFLTSQVNNRAGLLGSQQSSAIMQAASEVGCTCASVQRMPCHAMCLMPTGMAVRDLLSVSHLPALRLATECHAAQVTIISRRALASCRSYFGVHALWWSGFPPYTYTSTERLNSIKHCMLLCWCRWRRASMLPTSRSLFGRLVVPHRPTWMRMKS